MKSLEEFVLKDGVLSAKMLQDSWFPEVDADIFLSHSHKDLELALNLAGLINKKTGLDVFIDSTVWGSADELLKMIDDRYCYNSQKSTYIYEKRNRSTSHVHMILATALTKMIDRCECLFFLNTPASIDPENESEAGTSTGSPWIFHEVATAGLIGRRPPERAMAEPKTAKAIREDALSVQYSLDLGHMGVLDSKSIYFWLESSNWDREHPMDTLYGLK